MRKKIVISEIKAAIFFNGKLYSVEQPGRHAQVIQKICEEEQIQQVRGEEQGFLVNEKFFRRAALLAQLQIQNLLGPRVRDSNRILHFINQIDWKRAGRAEWDDLRKGEIVHATLHDGTPVYGHYIPKNEVLGGTLTSEDLW